MTKAAGAARNVSYGRLINFIKTAKRPLAIRFGPDVEKMPSGKALKLTKHVGGVAPKKSAASTPKPGEPLGWCDVNFNLGPFGLKLVVDPSGLTKVVDLIKVDGLVKRRGNIIRKGMTVHALQGKELAGIALDKVNTALDHTPSPRVIHFRDVALHSQIKEAVAEEEKSAGAS